VLIVTIGAAFSANKGAASMLQALIDNADDVGASAKVIVLSTYPEDDRHENPNHDVDVVSFTPREIVFPSLPLAVLIFVVRLLGGRGRFLAVTPALRTLMKADVVADLAGISFSDGRGLPTLAYNILMTGIPLLVGAPVVKCSQALGGFDEITNRVAAKAILPRVKSVVARGKQTRINLEHIGLTNVVEGADLAFLMNTPTWAVSQARELTADVDLPYVVVSPSSVVDEVCQKEGIDHIRLLTEACDRIVDELNRDVVIVAHSARPGKPQSRMNDLPICAEIARRMRRQDRVHLIADSLSAPTLRALIADADVLVTSRFHAMISGLATATPTLVIGWSHKYAEVMQRFDQEDLVLSYKQLSEGGVAERVAEIVQNRDAISSAVMAQLPTMTNESRVSLAELRQASQPSLPASSPDVEAPTDLAPVIGSDMCIACGACVHADPTVELRLDPVKQMYQPSHPGNALAAAVCPAIAVDYAGLQELLFPGSEQTPYGVVESVMLAQSVNHERNLKASSGGLIKELLIELLSRADVDGAIVLSEVAGLDFVPKLITDPTQVDDLPGSIYHNLPKEEVLTLLKESEGRFVLVGIPCEFEGIFQYIYAAAPELEAKVATTIGLLCGWQYNHHAIRAIAEYKGFQFDDIESISFRGGGPVGKLRVQTPEGEFSASRRIDFGYQVAFDRTFNTPRCHLCINHSNFLADIVVGDAWLPSTVGTRTGISLIINRTQEAHDLMTKLQDTGRVIATDVSVEEIKESQKPRVVFGDFAYAYADYRRQIGLHTPRLDGPNKVVATAIPNKEVAAFHQELVIKLGLQRDRRYRRLYWRKATRELPRFVGRYWEWFSVRILRIKSIRGERQELTRDQVSKFK